MKLGKGVRFAPGISARSTAGDGFWRPGTAGYSLLITRQGNGPWKDRFHCTGGQTCPGFSDSSHSRSPLPENGHLGGGWLAKRSFAQSSGTEGRSKGVKVTRARKLESIS